MRLFQSQFLQQVKIPSMVLPHFQNEGMQAQPTKEKYQVLCPKVYLAT